MVLKSLNGIKMTKEELAIAKAKCEKRNFVVCPHCGYNNKEYNALRYGTCTGCRQKLDSKTWFKYKICKNLKLKIGKVIWKKD